MGRGSLKNFRGQGSHFSRDLGRGGARRNVHPCSKALEPLGEPSLLVLGKKNLGIPSQPRGGGSTFLRQNSKLFQSEGSPKGGCQKLTTPPFPVSGKSFCQNNLSRNGAYSPTPLIGKSPKIFLKNGSLLKLFSKCPGLFLFKGAVKPCSAAQLFCCFSLL